MNQVDWVPFFTLLSKEVKRFMKVSAQTVLTPLVSASLYLLIFGVSLGRQIELENNISYLAFLIPGLVMMSCLNNAFQNSSSSIVSSKFSGDLEDLKISPLSIEEIIWAIAIGGLFRGFIVGFVTFLVGQVFYFHEYGSWIAISHPLHLVAFICLGGVAFALLGLSVAFWAKTFDQLAVVGSFILLPLIYLGGVFFSIEGLSPFWQSVSQFNPLFYFINGVRYGVLGISDVGLLNAYLISGVSLLLLYALAKLCLTRASFQRW